MLLKIERYDDRQCYWLYDDVKKISVSLLLHKGNLMEGYEGYHDEITSYDVVMFDYPDCGCPPDDGCNKCKGYRILMCRMSDGSEYSIAFDTLAYLLNDNGKTIEKIVANYRD